MRKVNNEEILEIINMFDHDPITADRVNEKLQNFGIDSIMFIQIIVQLEEMLECEIPDSKLLLGKLDTPQEIINTIILCLDDAYSE